MNSQRAAFEPQPEGVVHMCSDRLVTFHSVKLMVRELPLEENIIYDSLPLYIVQ